MTEQFPQTIAAAKRMQKDGWELGDALLVECGPPNELAGTKDGSYARIEAASKELLDNDMEFNTRYLAQLREICFKFPKQQRIVSISWRAHAMAQTPEFLHSLVDGAPKGTKITGDYVESMRKLQRKRDQHKREEEFAEAQREEAEAKAEAAAAVERERKAKDASEREAAAKARAKAKEKQDAARQKKVKASTPPAKGKPTPFEHRTDKLGIMAATSGFLGEASTAKLAARNATKRIEPVLKEIDQVDIAAMIEAGLEVFHAWHALIDMLRKRQQRGSHLNVVNE